MKFYNIKVTNAMNFVLQNWTPMLNVFYETEYKFIKFEIIIYWKVIIAQIVSVFP